MNIFVTDECPYKSAKYLDNKRVVKMVLETAQLLSTAINYHGGKGPYKSTHVNHPCSMWARGSRGNYNWLLKHFAKLSAEYTRRYGRVHKSSKYLLAFFNGRKLIPAGERTEFINCTRNKQLGIDYRNIYPVTKAYQLYLDDRWATDKREPEWF